jgi:hypothetical protein
MKEVAWANEGGVELTQMDRGDGGAELFEPKPSLTKRSAPKQAVVEGMLEMRQPFPIFFLFPLCVGLLFIFVGQTFNNSDVELEARR